jgi:hypothetical protein
MDIVVDPDPHLQSGAVERQFSRQGKKVYESTEPAHVQRRVDRRNIRPGLQQLTRPDAFSHLQQNFIGGRLTSIPAKPGSGKLA